jgi:hypothetical protein
MRQINSEIEIAAAPAIVWDILTDLGEHEDWDPFIVSAFGEVAVGSKLTVGLQLPGRKAQTFRPTVTVVEPGRKFEWLGVLGIKGLFDGRHQFVLEPTAEGTKFIQREEFTGILSAVLLKMIGIATQQGFEVMNQAIKERAEARVTERG